MIVDPGWSLWLKHRFGPHRGIVADLALPGGSAHCTEYRHGRPTQWYLYISLVLTSCRTLLIIRVYFLIRYLWLLLLSSQASRFLTARVRGYDSVTNRKLEIISFWCGVVYGVRDPYHTVFECQALRRSCKIRWMEWGKT